MVLDRAMGTYEIKHGDILATDTEALVNTVNCKGVMGRGLALQFKRRFPENFRAYRAECEAGRMEVGRVHVFETERITPRFIINFPTKNHWRSKSRITDIAEGLASLRDEARRIGIKSIAIPALGCDLGGLDWDEVRPLIEATVESIPGLRAELYSPNPSAGSEPSKPKRPVGMTRARAVLALLTDSYLRAGVGLFITNLEVQKLMYFMQVAGEPLRLDPTKGAYGPYLTRLRFVLRDMNGTFITGYKEVGDNPGDELRLSEIAKPAAERWLANNEETRTRIERVVSLVEGFESQLGLEALSTVHWIATEARSTDLDDIIHGVKSWSTRKSEIMNRWRIEVCLNRLIEQGWIGSDPSG